MFGYSPFECDFPDGAARPRVVECSYLRVIGRVPFPARHPYSPRLVETVGCVLVLGFGREGDPPSDRGRGRVVRTHITYTYTNQTRWILQQDPKRRPYVTDVLRRVEELIGAAPPDPDRAGGGSAGLSSSSSSSMGGKAVAAASPAGSVALEMASLAGGAR